MTVKNWYNDGEKSSIPRTLHSKTASNVTPSVNTTTACSQLLNNVVTVTGQKKDVQPLPDNTYT